MSFFLLSKETHIKVRYIAPNDVRIVKETPYTKERGVTCHNGFRGK